MFSYYQIYPTSINKTAGGPSSEDGVTANVSEMTSHQSIRSGYFLSIGIKLLCKTRPKHPQHGFISLLLVFIATIGIFGILFIITCHQIYAHSGSSEGGQPVSLIRPSKGGTIGISEGAVGISEGANTLGFTTSLADVDTEQLNTQVHFDTDSLFFVCDNSTTGHICNDIWKFVPGSI
jgi:hypothetical protein